MIIATRLEFFESGLGLIAARIGVIPIGSLVKYDIYKTYKEFLKAGDSEEESRKKTVDATRYHYSTIARAIYWFERDDFYHYHKAAQTHLQICENGPVK